MEQKPPDHPGEEAQRLLAILETIPNAIIVMDDDGNIETFNLASEPLFQFTAEEVIGQNIAILLPALFAPTDAQATAPPGPLVGGAGRELSARRKDGSSFPVELAIGEMNLSGKRLLVCALKDITVRVRAQEAAKEARDQLMQAEKMASLGGLVAGVAHEINTPVGIAVTAASHLRDEYQGLDAEFKAGALKRSTLNKFLDTCDHATRILETNLRRASELINSFKQIAVDRSAGRARFFGVRAYLEELLVSLRPALKKTPHQIHLSCPSDLKIFADPGSLSQVLTNLIMNSLTHAYEPGRAGHLRIAIEPDEAGIRLDYSDDGKGIPKDDLPRIFDPFFTTRRGDGGSGLGLHIVYNATKNNLAGSIRCTSKPGEGTRFQIRIPCPRETE